LRFYNELAAHPPRGLSYLCNFFEKEAAAVGVSSFCINIPDIRYNVWIDKKGETVMIDIGRLFDNENEVIVPDDCFTCGMGLYASVSYGDDENLLVLEMVNLKGQKLGKGLEDYCFLVSIDFVAGIKAKKRRNEGISDPAAVLAAKLSDMRSLWEIEEDVLGGRLLDNKEARGALFYHEQADDYFDIFDVMADGEEKILKDPAADEQEIRVGDRVLGIYDVLEGPIKGGMGDVFKMRHVGWGVDLAVKRPHDDMFVSEIQKQTFIRECDTWVNLGICLNIVQCFYVRDLHGVPAIFSEWIDGGSLKDWIVSGRLYEGAEETVRERILDIAIQTARGLCSAHESGLIHRDVKPSNLLLTAGGIAKVADFGIACSLGAPAESETRLPGSGPYTPAYCSPEQQNRETITKSTDIYSFAVCVLEMYLGERPWNSGVVAGLAFDDYRASMRIPLSRTMEIFLRNALAEDPKDRPYDFAEVEMELLLAYEEETGHIYPRASSQIQKDRPDFLNNRALSLLDIGRPDEAVACWEKALKIEPNYAEALTNLEIFRLRQKARDDSGEEGDYLKKAAARLKYSYSRIWQEAE